MLVYPAQHWSQIKHVWVTSSSGNNGQSPEETMALVLEAPRSKCHVIWSSLDELSPAEGPFHPAEPMSLDHSNAPCPRPHPGPGLWLSGVFVLITAANSVTGVREAILITILPGGCCPLTELELPMPSVCFVLPRLYHVTSLWGLFLYRRILGAGQRTLPQESQLAVPLAPKPHTFSLCAMLISTFWLPDGI